MTAEPLSATGGEGGPANLWIGLLDLEILPGCTVFEDHSDARGAVVYFLAMARSEEEFRDTAKASAERHDFRVCGMKEVLPWETWRKTATDVEDYLFERATETVKDGGPRFGTFHLYLED